MLNAIYEEDFFSFCHGYRPRRGPHDALDALAVALKRKRVNWVLEADIQSFFDTMGHEWLRRFLEHRIGDQRVIRLILKWLKAGVMEDGEWTASEEGSPQGGTISPLLANIYLYYAFDQWAHHWRKTVATGDVVKAFEYGVHDLVPKPFGRERLERALQRVLTPSVRADRPIEHLGIRRAGAVSFVRVGDIAWIRGAGTRSELILTNGTTALHDKLLDRLEGLLPDHFQRIHKSYIIDTHRIARLVTSEGSRYSVVLRDGTTLPVGRTRVAAVRGRVG